MIARLYQPFVSPRLRSGRRFAIICRFHPSCSEYAVLALRKHGAVPGLGKTLGRLRRCRPDNYENCFDVP
jgi:putative component of membrane protein insertase Oxa1/YidC/SpoIIIJ protein YidD